MQIASPIWRGEKSTCAAPASRRNHSLRRISLVVTATQGVCFHRCRTCTVHGINSSSIERRTSTIKNNTSQLLSRSIQADKLSVSSNERGKPSANLRTAVAHHPVSSQITICSVAMTLRIVEFNPVGDNRTEGNATQSHTQQNTRKQVRFLDYSSPKYWMRLNNLARDIPSHRAA